MSPRGFTLVETLVVLAILSIVLSTATLGFPSASGEAKDARVDALRDARVRAIQSGRAVQAGDPRPILFLPDGRAIGPGVDPLTGDLPDPVH